MLTRKPFMRQDVAYHSSFRDAFLPGNIGFDLGKEF